MATKGENLVTAGSNTELVVKAFITAGYSARRGPRGHEQVVIRITTGYHTTVGEGGSGEMHFCSSVDLILKAVEESTSKGRAISLYSRLAGLVVGLAGPTYQPFGVRFGEFPSSAF
jgi:hypothetical protein